MTNQTQFAHSWRTLNDTAATFAERIEAHAALLAVLKRTRKSPTYYGITHVDITDAVKLLTRQMDEFAKATLLPLPYDPQHRNAVQYRFTDMAAMSPPVDDISEPNPAKTENVARITSGAASEVSAPVTHEEVDSDEFPWWVVRLILVLLALSAVIVLAMD